MRLLCLTLLLLNFSLQVFSQSDSAAEKTKKPADSLFIYRKIEKLSKKNRWLYEAYKSVFTYKSPDQDTIAKKIQSPRKTREIIHKRKTIRTRDISDYNGSIIRNIYITSLDPSGYSITDTAKKPVNLADRATNLFHIKSARFTIRNHLLFRSGDTLDHFKIRESERLIRTSNYIHDAIIRVVPDSSSEDTVDVYIRTQDRWSLYPNYNWGGPWSVGFKDDNLIGLGQSLEQIAYVKGLSVDSTIYYRGNYVVPYIRNTFITARVFYNTDITNQNKGVSLHRPFYSPLTRWAGAAELYNYKLPTAIRITDTSAVALFLEYTNVDIWNGWSFPLFKSNDNAKRGTRLIVAYRYFHQSYINTIRPDQDDFLNFQNRDSWFASLSVSQRKFYRDKYIYRFGTTEDVPTGFLASFTGGFQNRQFGPPRMYTGFRLALNGHLPNLIYGNFYLEAGGYSNKGVMEQGVTRLGFGTFTSLINLGSWKWRQFFVTEITYGINRSINERITINNENGLRGFSSPTLSGTNKFIAYLQSQVYLPYRVLGFSFAPVMYIGIGMVGSENNLFIENKPYPVFALGLQFRNELLIFNTFQFTFGFYPEIPGQGNMIYKLNPVRTTDLQFRQFYVDKPGEVGFY